MWKNFVNKDAYKSTGKILVLSAFAGFYTATAVLVWRKLWEHITEHAGIPPHHIHITGKVESHEIKENTPEKGK